MSGAQRLPQETQAPFPPGPGVRTCPHSVAVGRGQRGSHCLGFPCLPPLPGRSDTPSTRAGEGRPLEPEVVLRREEMTAKESPLLSLCAHSAIEKHFLSEV